MHFNPYSGDDNIYTTKQAKAFLRQTLWGRTEEQFFLIKKSHYNALPRLSPVSFADSKNNRLHCMFIYSFVFSESYIRIITSKYTFMIDTHTGCISRNNRYNEKKNQHHLQQQQYNPRGIHWRGTIAFDRSNGAKMRTQQMHRIYTYIYMYIVRGILQRLRCIGDFIYYSIFTHHRLFDV